MPEEKQKGIRRKLRMRYRSRIGQVWIYLGKMLRMFVYQNDWKVLPISAMVAGLVALVIRYRFFFSMEGTLMSALAVTCLCLWNGCFNSIQVVCRERDVIKREPRSGMHISSYISAHMLYQALLCLLQTGITLYVTGVVGIHYPQYGLITHYFYVDFFISMFLITYAADMMSLWISTLCHTTTVAMTVMPVVLILQLVFSGGMMNLPARAEPLTRFIISNYGVKLIAAQADYNSQPLASAWNTVERMKGNEIKGTITVGEVLDYLGDAENPDVQGIRNIQLGDSGIFGGDITVGRVIDFANAENSQDLRDQPISIDTTVGQLITMLGEEEFREYVETQAKATAQVPAYEYSRSNIVAYWISLVMFAFFFAGLSVVTLEFIDKDKR